MQPRRGQRRRDRHRRGDRRRRRAAPDHRPRRARRQRRPDPVRPRPRRHRVLQRARSTPRSSATRQSPLTAALSLGYLLTDDPYADAHPLSVGPRELFVPTIAIGRLVETPAEIKTALDNYVRFDGELDPTTALSTGYDFLTDGAEAVAEALRERLGNGDCPTDVELIGDDVDRDAQLDARPSTAGARHRLGQRPLRPLPRPARPIRTPRRPGRPVHARRRDSTTRTEADARRRRAVLDGLPRRPVGERHHRVGVRDRPTGRRRSRVPAPCSPATPATATATTPSSAPPRTLMRRFAGEPRWHADRRPGDGPGQAAVHRRRRAVRDPVRREGRRRRSSCTACRSYRIGDDTPEEPPADPPLVVDPDTRARRRHVDLTGTVGQPGSEFEVVSTDRGSTTRTTATPWRRPISRCSREPIVDLTQPGRDLRGVLLTGLTSTDLAAPDPVYFTPTVDLAATSPEVSASSDIVPDRAAVGQPLRLDDRPAATR